MLIVNTASECGFTPQLEGLQKLYDQYNKQGLETTGFPCNQFGDQEPGSESEIASFCQKNYGVTFTMFSKIDVNGNNAHPLFKHLTSQTKGILGEKIKWNFTKFLIDKDGMIVDRFAPQKKPESLKRDIQKILNM